MDLIQMKQRCPKSELIDIGKLIGYRLDFTHYSLNWKGGVADIVSDNEYEVWGLVYQLSKSDLDNLDRYECYPDIYTRFKIVVLTSTNRKANVWVYAVVNKGSFKPTRDYLDIIKKSALKYQFPSSYIEKLNNIKTI